MKKIIGILSVLLVLTLIAVVLYFAFRSTPNSNNPAAYSVKINGKEYSDGDFVVLKYGENLIEIKKPFYESNAVSVSVHRNEKADFDFQADGKIMGYAGIDDMTKAFVFKTEKSDVTLTIPNGMTMQQILQALYPESEITHVPEADFINQSYFYLLIAFENKQIRLNLTIGSVPTAIELDPPSIIF